MIGIYVSGTDTGVGKTMVSASLLVALNAASLHSVGMKPVASGCAATAHGLRNADAEVLLAHSAGRPNYASANPYAFADPIAPHLAAADAGIEIDLARIIHAFDSLSASAQCVVVEGVGGWMAPLGPTLMQADLARALKLPVILVVGLRLGCINHALLTTRAILADGCELVGWIGNGIDAGMLRPNDNLAALRQRLPAPCLGVVPFASDADPKATAVHLHAAVDRVLR